MNTYADRVELQSGTIIGLGLLKEMRKSVTELIGTIDRDRDHSFRVLYGFGLF